MTKIRQNRPKQSHKNTPYTKRQKLTKQGHQKSKTIQNNVQYSDSYKSLKSTVPKNNTKTKKIPLIIK